MSESWAENVRGEVRVQLAILAGFQVAHSHLAYHTTIDHLDLISGV